MILKTNRKSATGLLLVQWSRFSHINIKIEGSSLITGVNGTGKSTILDAITYLLTGNTQFNIAAKDKDRNIAAYVRGDTKSDGKARYLRDGDVVSYIAMEFFSPEENDYFVAFVCIEMVKEQHPQPNWYIARSSRLSDINFYDIQGKSLMVTPKNQLQVKGHKLSSKDFMGRDKGTEQLIKALGLRCEVSKYRSKLVKMMAFDPQKNIDKFIQECVLEAGEMTSLTSLREQRANFDEIQEAYNSMLASKKKLEEIEQQTCVYEQRYDEYNKRKLMFRYQEWRRTEYEKEKIFENIESEKINLETMISQLEKVKKELELARERVRKAESSDLYQDIENIIISRENDLKVIEDKISEFETSYLKLLELAKKISEVMPLLKEYGIDDERYSVLYCLEKEDIDPKLKREDFLKFTRDIENILESIRRAKFENDNQVKALQEELKELENQKKHLENNQFVFDRSFVDARHFIKSELKKRNIVTDVRFFVELISNISDKKWRKAVETFLGNKRFNIIVDGKYCQDVLEIINANPSIKSKVVITDKLPESDIRQDSAASLLEISNVYARRYANYLLNGIHLCDSVESLHEHPLGGLMANGMLAKSYASNKMDMSRTKLFVGQDAIKQQLFDVQKEIESKQELVISLSERYEEFERKIKKLNSGWSMDGVDFDAPLELKETREKKVTIATEIKKYRSDPGFMAILQERDTAKEEEKRIEDKVSDIQKKIGGAEEKIKQFNNSIIEMTEKSKMMEEQFEDEARNLSAYRQLAIDEYESLSLKQHTVNVIAKKTVDDWEKRTKDAAKQLEDLHLDYCRINGTDNLYRGISFIGHYRDEYRNLANVKIEEAQEKLRQQSYRLQNAFVGDFVAELDEAIIAAREEIDKINRELKKLPFGADTYFFKMEERPERKLFFDICKRLHDHLNNAEYYLNSIKDDEAAESELKDFLDIILAEEDESEYTDYRKYFTYDMKITSKQGDEIVTADYSNKQGSASNGEKQTPYFIILAASLMQCYPKQKCCARLAFIDEAFSALSKERIEQMVKYLEDNDFQVIYAAPPEKINSIGRHIQSTISLIPKGRYTYAVEGLVKNIEIEGA